MRNVLHQVYDGENSSSLMGVHCGNINPYPMISSSNKVKLKFQSDETITGTGFTMYYTINNRQSTSLSLSLFLSPLSYPSLTPLSLAEWDERER